MAFTLSSNCFVNELLVFKSKKFLFKFILINSQQNVTLLITTSRKYSPPSVTTIHLVSFLTPELILAPFGILLLYLQSWSRGLVFGLFTPNTLSEQTHPFPRLDFGSAAANAQSDISTSHLSPDFIYLHIQLPETLNWSVPNKTLRAALLSIRYVLTMNTATRYPAMSASHSGYLSPSPCPTHLNNHQVLFSLPPT